MAIARGIRNRTMRSGWDGPAPPDNYPDSDHGIPAVALMAGPMRFLHIAILRPPATSDLSQERMGLTVNG